ncbi:MAG: hypothetical protein ACKVX7_09905 [Planctomycetota bacterium]
MSVVRRLVARAAADSLWSAARGASAETSSSRSCPDCHDSLCCAARGFDGEDAPQLDVCLRCQLVWFDRDELCELPARSAQIERKIQLDPRLAQAMSAYQADLATRQKAEADHAGMLRRLDAGEYAQLLELLGPWRMLWFMFRHGFPS